jgi:uncharacterized membrane protein
MFRNILLGLAIALSGSAPAYAKHIMTTFDAPGATITFPYSINRAGSVAGYYYTSDGGVHGFLRTPDGTITTFDPPESTGTVAYSINDAGVIAGGYEGRYPQSHGFVRAADGTITSFDAPGSENTQAVGINDSGFVTGSYRDGVSVYHGFLRDPGGTITSFDPPGATYTWPGCPTSIGDGSAINRKGSIAGCFGDGQGSHVFVRATDGEITAFDVPGGPYAVGINRKGAIAGSYQGQDFMQHGFVRAPDGTVTVIDVGGSTGTQILSMNDSGTVVGYWTDTDYMTEHGFVRTPDGKIQSFRCRGSRATYPLAINDDGSIVGFCYPPTGGHAFLRTRQ